ncbi:Uncharacterized protein TCM_025722 [Theobroma cacao]|uniref:Uncharacterized protein n=1 Tax=Theobroma cacao TaxID=3641 RepID=A0A061F0C0_THECC|nr:Uncharacterized protein TCM_025722 [Theobroma cacao]
MTSTIERLHLALREKATNNMGALSPSLARKSSFTNSKSCLQLSNVDYFHTEKREDKTTYVCNLFQGYLSSC